MTSPPPLPTLTGVLNFRGLGGLPGADDRVVRHGHIFRSGHLATATDEDLTLLGELGITTIIDFRTEVDKAGDGGVDQVPEGARLVELPMTDSAGRGAEIRETLMSGNARLIRSRYGNGKAVEIAMAGAVTQAVDPEKQAVYAAFLDHVVQTERRPLLFHCSAGKDRAGWAATLVGMALGVPDDQLVEHYLLSNVHRPAAGRQAHFEAALGIDVSDLVPFLQVDERYIRAALAAVDERWPSRSAYLDDALGLDASAVDRLRDELLE